MRNSINVAVTLSIALILHSSVLLAQQPSKILDAETKAKMTVNGFCLCDIKLSDLTTLSDDFRKTEVEEMDTPKNCYAQDSRFTNGSGIASGKYPGMIFQQGNVEDYLGKIRLTREFRGKLPNGAEVDLSKMKLRDVFTIYPQLKDAWGSRGCSDYWHFSDETISFYVRIDKAIQPQFPIRESDYMDRPVEGIDIVASCYSYLVPDRPIQLFRPGEPMYFVDSIRTNESFLSKNYDPKEFAQVTVVKGEQAIRIGGKEAKNGIIYIYTKEYARQEFWSLFKSMSKSYAEAVPAADTPDVVYILNGKILAENYESELFSISKTDIKEIRVLNSEQLAKQFGTRGSTGVMLKTKKSTKDQKK